MAERDGTSGVYLSLHDMQMTNTLRWRHTIRKPCRCCPHSRGTHEDIPGGKCLGFRDGLPCPCKGFGG